LGKVKEGRRGQGKSRIYKGKKGICRGFENKKKIGREVNRTEKSGGKVEKRIAKRRQYEQSEKKTLFSVGKELMRAYIERDGKKNLTREGKKSGGEREGESNYKDLKKKKGATDQRRLTAVPDADKLGTPQKRLDTEHDGNERGKRRDRE